MVVEVVRMWILRAAGSGCQSRSSACEQRPRGHVEVFLVVDGSAGLASLQAAAACLVQREMYYIQPLARNLLEPRSFAPVMWLHSTYHRAAAALANKQAKQGDRPGHVCMGEVPAGERGKETKEEGAVN